jgi:hypothetical protein
MEMAWARLPLLRFLQAPCCYWTKTPNCGLDNQAHSNPLQPKPHTSKEV